MVLEEKFIAFVDILGFTKMVEAAEREGSGDFSRLVQLTEILGSKKEVQDLIEYGSTTCPGSRQLSKDLNFKATQISDCVVVSSEVSPAGVLNIVKHCWLISSKLLDEGVLCRGVITRGNILHTEGQFFGTGYMHAYNSEKYVKFLRAHDQEEGTPFIELESTVSDYIRSETDPCVREMCQRMTHSDGTYTAVYPFHALGNAPFAYVDHNFDPKEWKEAVQRSIGYRTATLSLFEAEEARVSDEKVKAKIRHYKRGLQQVIERLKRKEDDLDRMILTGHIPYGTGWGD